MVLRVTRYYENSKEFNFYVYILVDDKKKKK